jgi:hypothetical protein
MDVSMMATGRTTTWTALAFTRGRTVAVMKVNTRRIRSMARVYTLGPMDVATTACGRMVDSMGKESTSRGRARSVRASGTMEGAKNGWMNHSSEKFQFPNAEHEYSILPDFFEKSNEAP